MRAAYDARKAELDITMRIPAFACLTQARQKVLFKAEGIQREAFF